MYKDTDLYKKNYGTPLHTTPSRPKASLVHPSYKESNLASN